VRDSCIAGKLASECGIKIVRKGKEAEGAKGNEEDSGSPGCLPVWVELNCFPRCGAVLM
jgi:hypothetical protein